MASAAMKSFFASRNASMEAPTSATAPSRSPMLIRTMAALPKARPRFRRSSSASLVAKRDSLVNRERLFCTPRPRGRFRRAPGIVRVACPAMAEAFAEKRDRVVWIGVF